MDFEFCNLSKDIDKFMREYTNKWMMFVVIIQWILCSIIICLNHTFIQFWREFPLWSLNLISFKKFSTELASLMNRAKFSGWTYSSPTCKNTTSKLTVVRLKDLSFWYQACTIRLRPLLNLFWKSRTLAAMSVCMVNW